MRLSDGFFRAYAHAFEEYKNIEVFGGKIKLSKIDFQLPEWLALTGPMARTMIVVSLNHGDKNAFCGLSCSCSPISMNMAIKRSAFEKYGYFRTDVGLTGTNLVPGADYELFMRFSKNITEWAYLSGALVYHPLKKTQATKSYFKRRMFGVGRVSYRLNDFKATKTIFGLPLYILVFIIENFLRYLKYLLKRKPVETFFYQTEVIQYCGCVYEHFYKKTQ